VIARTAGLLLLVGVFRLAHRFAGVAAGVIATGLMVLTPDPDPRFVRILLEAHGAPIEAALAIWAIDRHLEGQRATALLLGSGLALMRPEAWPFLGLYVLWLWWYEPRLRTASVVAVAVVPVLWFGGGAGRRRERDRPLRGCAHPGVRGRRAAGVDLRGRRARQCGAPA
jgi:hypothetical protein